MCKLAIFLFAYGTEYHAVRVGFTGQRPLVYAVYAYNLEGELPYIQGQTYKRITKDQYEWLRGHLLCDVCHISGEWAGRDCNLECRTHGCHYKLFDEDPGYFPDLWDERLI